MIRYPNITRSNLVIDSLRINPLYQAGFSFTGKTGKCQIIAINSIPDKRSPKIVQPVYTVRRGDNSKVKCLTWHIYKTTNTLPSGQFVFIRMDDLDWTIVHNENKFNCLQIKDKQDALVQYEDNFGYNISAIVRKALVKYALFASKIPEPEEILTIQNLNRSCRNCGARRNLRGPDVVIGDSGATAPSTGTCDKSGPYKNLLACAWIGEANPYWQQAQDRKNWAVKNNYKPPEIDTDEVGTGCPRVYSQDSVPSFKALGLQHDEKNDLYWIEVPGWDIELPGVKCKL